MDALVNVVIPVFGVIGSGYLAGRFNILGPESAAALNRFVYYFALPPLLFVFTARAPVDKIFNWPFVGAYIGGGTLTLVIALLVGRFYFRLDPAALSVHGLVAVFGNTANLGIPLLITAYGAEGALPAILASVATNFVFITSLIGALEAFRAVGPSPLRVTTRVTRTLLQNPLLVAPILGIACSMAGISIPKPIGNFFDLMAAAAGPAALFAVGLSLVDRKLMGNAAEIGWLVILKLSIYPLLTYFLVAHVFEMDRVWSQAAVLLAATPTGALTFVIAQQYGAYVQSTSTAIVASTAISVATLSFLLISFTAG